MKRLTHIVFTIILLLGIVGISYAEPPAFIFQGGGKDSRIGTLINGKWCSTNGTVITCTDDAPAGAGDITSVGDAGATGCNDGACTYFAIGGVKLGDESPDSDGEFGFASNQYIFYGGALVPATDNAYALGSTTGSKRWSDIFLGDGAVINFNGGDVTLTHGSNVLTLGGGDLALGANNITMTGSLGATGAGKLTKVWTVDVDSTNAPVVGGYAANATGGLVTNPMTAVGDLITGAASGASTGKIAAVAVGQVLGSAGVGTAPAYTANPQVTTIELGHASDSTLARVSAGVVSVENKTVVLEGAATGGIVLGDASPDADGEIGYATNAFLWFANSEDFKATASANMWTFDSNTSAAFTFTPAVTITGLLTANGGISVPNGKLIDLSGITMSTGVDEGLALPTYADVVPTTEKYYVAYDAGNNALMVREAGGWVNVGASAAAPTNAHYVVTGTNANLTEESVLTAGLAIGITDAGGDGGAVTVAFDPTGLTGNRTFAAGGAAAVTWTWDNSGTTDPALVFGDGVITTNSKLSPTADDGAALGDTTHNWSDLFLASGSVINWANSDLTLTHGSNVLTLAGGNLALGANSITGTGSLGATGAGKFTKLWSVDAETTNIPSVNGVAGNATSGLVTNPMTTAGDLITGGASGVSTGRIAAVAAGQPLLSGGVATAPAYAGYTFSGTAAQTYTYPAATTTLAGLATAQTFTANNTFGNADSDLLSIQASIKGVGRAVTIDDDGTASPTYATATQSLFVTGAIETAGTVYAAAFNGGAGTDGSRELILTTNTGANIPTATGNKLYFIDNVLKVVEDGTAKDVPLPGDSVTWTGTSHSFAGVTNFRLPTASADTSGEMSINPTNHQLLFHTGGASADNALQTFDFDTCSAGYVLKTDGSGNWTCAVDATSGAPTLDSIAAPTGDTTIIVPAGAEVNFDYTGNFTTGSQFKIEQKTGNPSGGTLFEVKAADTDITLAKLGDGTNYIQISQAGNISHAGTSVFTAPRVATSIAPSSAGGATLGTTALEWGNVYLTDSAVIYGQANQSATFTSSASLWTANNFASTGTLAAGGGGFTVDADGDVVAKSLTISKVASTASTSLLYTDYGTTDYFGVGWKGPHATSSRGSDTYLALPNADPAAGQVMAFTAPSTGTATGSWVLPALSPAAGQVSFAGPTQARTVTLPDAAVTIPANPIGGTLGATTNVIPKASGTGTATLQASGITEDGTNISAGALNFVTTGTINGAIKTEKDDDSLADSQCYGTFHWYSGGAETITLPAAVVGMNLCIYSSDASVKNIDPNGTDTIVLTTAALTAGYQIESPGAAGDFICLVSFTANQWTALGRSGVWITHGAD